MTEKQCVKLRGQGHLKHLTQRQIGAVIKAAEALNAASPAGEQGVDLLGRHFKAERKSWKKLRRHDDAVRAAITRLSLDTRSELIALMWLGRGDVEGTFSDLLQYARDHSDAGDIEYVADKSPRLVLRKIIRKGGNETHA